MPQHRNRQHRRLFRLPVLASFRQVHSLFCQQDKTVILLSADRTLEVYDENSDVIVYCPETHKILRPALTNIKDKFETMPAFSADGKTLFFSVADAGELPRDAMRMKYSLCSLAFDPETGAVRRRM